jgi:hypothetical protein
MDNPNYNEEDLIILRDQNAQRFNKLSESLYQSESIAKTILARQKLAEAAALPDAFKDGYVNEHNKVVRPVIDKNGDYVLDKQGRRIYR